jgi:hypothetical protein
MSIQQAEGRHLRERSIVMRRQALRRTVASVPRRDRLASILVLLLTATGWLVTPTFGDNREEIREYRHRMRLEMLKRGLECNFVGNLNQIAKCKKEVSRIYEECMQKPESCGAIEEPPKAPVPVGCPGGEVPKGPQGNCIPEAVALATCLDPDGDTLFNLGKCTKICEVTESQDLITDGGATVAGATGGAKAGSILCPPFVLTGPGAWTVLGCYAFTTMIGGQLGYLGSQAVDTCSKKCWIDFQMDLERCRRSIKRAGRGEGTIQFEYAPPPSSPGPQLEVVPGPQLEVEPPP